MASINQQLAITFTCPCTPGHVFPTRAAICIHKKTNKHQAWENRNNSNVADLTRRDNKITQLEAQLEYQTRLNEEKVEVIGRLKEQLRVASEASTSTRPLLSNDDIEELARKYERVKRSNTDLRRRLVRAQAELSDTFQDAPLPQD